MTDSIPQGLETLERRAYSAVFGNGLWDMLLGSFFLLLSASITWRATVNPGIVCGVAGGMSFPLWRLLYIRLVEPRLGFVALRPERMARMRRRALYVAGLILAIIAVGASQASALGNVVFPALIFAVPFAAAGKLLEMPRLYLYAAFIVAERAIDTAFGAPHDLLFWFSGSAIFVTGCAALRRFQREYPHE